MNNKGRTHKTLNGHTSRKIARTKRALTSAAHHVKARLNHFPRKIVGLAKRNPLKIVGISVLAGAAIARLFRLRHK